MPLFSSIARSFLPYNYRTPPFVGNWNFDPTDSTNQNNQDQTTLPPKSTNYFGVNTPLPVNTPTFTPNINTPTVNTDSDTPPDFAGQYAKIVGDRPNRLAYQQAVQQGPPQIQRSKWAALGAALAAGGSSLSGVDPGNAAKLAISAYQTPQVRSDQLYTQRLAGLGNLAQFEDQDKADAIKALEMQQSDWYKRREDLRQQAASVREDKLSDAQIKNIQSEMDKRDTDEWIDPNTGIKWQRDKAGTLTQIGKVQLTPAEKETEAGLIAQKEAEGRLPSETKLQTARDAAASALEDKRGEVAKEVARIGATSRETVAETNRKARVDAVNAKNLAIGNKAFKPGDVYKQVWNDLSAKFASDPNLAGEDFTDYINAQAAPGGGIGSITVKDPSIFDRFGPNSDRDAAIRKTVEDTINASLKNSQGGGNVNRPAPSPAAGTIDTRRFIKDPNNPLNTIPNPNFGKPIK